MNSEENIGLVLFNAIKNGNEVEVENILNSDSKPNLEDISGEDGVITNLLTLGSHSVLMVHGILNSYSDRISVDDKREALKNAASKGYREIVSLLLEKCSNEINVIGYAALRCAASNGHHEIVALLLEKCSNEIDPDEKGWILEYAAKNGHPHIVLLLEKCSNEINNYYKNCAFSNAAENGHDQIAARLLDKYELNINKSQELLDAARKGHHQIVALLLEKYSDEINVRKSMLLLTAARMGHHETIALLLNKYSNEIDADVISQALILAAKHGHHQSVMLLASEENVDRPNDDGFTPLHYASFYGHVTVVEALIAAGANVNQQIFGVLSPIINALENGFPLVVALLQHHGAILPEHLQGHAEDINEAQSVHTVSVHVGVSKAAKALKENYFKSSIQQNKVLLNTAWQAFEKFVNDLPYDEANQNLLNKNGAAKRCLTWLKSTDFTDLRSGITLKEALELFWLSLTDKEEINALEKEAGLVAEFELDDEALKTRYQERKNVLIENVTETLYLIVRGYNINKQGKDDGKEDRHTCLSGSFNKIIYALKGRHSLVQIEYVTKKTILSKASKLVNKIFDDFELDAKQKYADEWQGSMSKKLIMEIGENLAFELHDEFDAFNSEGVNVEETITDILNSLEWMTPKWIKDYLDNKENVIDEEIEHASLEGNEEEILNFHNSVDDNSDNDNEICNDEDAVIDNVFDQMSEPVLTLQPNKKRKRFTEVEKLKPWYWDKNNDDDQDEQPRKKCKI